MVRLSQDDKPLAYLADDGLHTNAMLDSNSDLLAAEGDLDADPADDMRQSRVRELAYSLAEKRGFEPGFEWDDWLEAERQIETDAGD